MIPTTSGRLCPDCGTAVPLAAPEGLCPRCLALAAVGSADEPSPAANNAAEQFTSQRFFGDYELLGEIARGGMGIVLKARQLGVNRIVALKLLAGGAGAGQDFVHRFHTEAAAAARLDHPHIVPIYEFGEHEGAHFLAMRFLEGGTLQTRIAKELPTPTGAAGIIIAVANAVEHAHRRGVLHRDLKPGNVLLDAEGSPLVADFGLARLLEEDSSLTLSRAVIGTAAYLAPEVAMGGAARATTAGDIYGLGAILYELLTGRPPFTAESFPALLKKIAEEEPVAPSAAAAAAAPRVISNQSSVTRTISAGGASTGRLATRTGYSRSVPRDLETICLKSLEKEPGKRYATAQELADDLSRFLRNEPILARPVSRFERGWRWCQRKPALAGSLAAAAILLLAMLIGSPIAIYRITQARNAEAAERQHAQTEAARAEAEALKARQSAYASDMNLAHQAVQDGDLFRAVQLLERHRPGFVFPPSGGSASGRSLTRSNRLKAGLQTDLRGWEWRYLWKQCEGDPYYLLGSHTNEVTAVGLLSDGTTAFSASKDHTVKLWDLPSRKLLTELPHDEPVWGGVASPDGRWFVSLTLNLDYRAAAKPVRLWDLSSRRQVAVLFTNVWPRPGPSLAISPDSRLLAFIDQEDPERLVVCELPSGREIVRFPAQTDLVGSQGVVFAPDGQTLAYSANLQGDIALIDTQQWKEVGRLSGHTRNVNCLAVSPDNRFLASIGNDRSLRLWNLRDRRQQAMRERLSDTSWTLAFSPDGTRLAVGIKSSISVFSVPEFAPVTELRWLSKGATAVKFLSNRELLAGGGDGSVKVFDLDSQQRPPDRTRIPAGLAQLGTTTGLALCLSPDGTHLLAVFTNNTFMLWQTLTMAQSGPFPLPLPSFSCAAISPGGELAAFADHEGNTVLWRSTNGTRTGFGRPETNEFIRIVFSQDGRRLAFAGRNRITVWEVATRKQLQAFPKTHVATMKLVFSTDGETLAACEFTGDVLVSHLNQPGHALTLRGHLMQAGSPAFTRDGNTLITPGGDLRFWDLRTGTQRNLVEGLPGEAAQCAISPDGRRLAVGMKNGTISILDLVSMQEVALFREFDSGVTRLAFTPDGNTLIATTTEEIRAWRAAPLAESDQPTSLNTTKGNKP